MRSGERESTELLCPFCRSKLARPVEKQITRIDRLPCGECAGCGAMYFLDPTGKNVGEVMVQGLEAAAARLSKDSADMVAGADYEDMVLSYDWRTHRSTGEPTGFMDGRGRLYFIKIKKSGNT